MEITVSYFSPPTKLLHFLHSCNFFRRKSYQPPLYPTPHTLHQQLRCPLNQPSSTKKKADNPPPFNPRLSKNARPPRSYFKYCTLLENTFFNNNSTTSSRAFIAFSYDTLSSPKSAKLSPCPLSEKCSY